MRMIKWKRGSLNVLDFLRIFLIIIVLTLILFILPALASMNIKNNTAEQMVLDRLIFNSISAFSYVDDNGRVHPGIIDLKEFTQEDLEKAIILPKKEGLLLKLSSDDDEVNKKIHINEDYALLAGGLSSTYDVETTKEPVLIKAEDGFVQGTLEITYVLRKNR